MLIEPAAPFTLGLSTPARQTLVELIRDPNVPRPVRHAAGRILSDVSKVEAELIRRGVDDLHADTLSRAGACESHQDPAGDGEPSDSQDGDAQSPDWDEGACEDGDGAPATAECGAGHPDLG